MRHFFISLYISHSLIK